MQQLALFSPILIFFQDGKTRTTLFFRFLRQWIRQAFILKIMRLCYSFFRLRKEVPSFKLSIYANRFTKPGNHCLSNAIFLASTFWLDKAVPLTKPFYLDLQRNAFVPRAFFFFGGTFASSCPGTFLQLHQFLDETVHAPAE